METRSISSRCMAVDACSDWRVRPIDDRMEDHLPEGGGGSKDCKCSQPRQFVNNNRLQLFPSCLLICHSAPLFFFPLSPSLSLVLYCIVLYLYIYIALLAVHTNQKRFQCERPREKKAVLRERKDALGILPPSLRLSLSLPRVFFSISSFPSLYPFSFLFFHPCLTLILVVMLSLPLSESMFLPICLFVSMFVIAVCLCLSSYPRDCIPQLHALFLFIKPANLMRNDDRSLARGK